MSIPSVFRRPFPVVFSFSLFLISILLTPASAVCPEIIKQYIVSGQESPVDKQLLAFSAVIHDASGTCTATVLNNNYLLTAAHCAYRPGAKIRVGRRLREGPADTTVMRFVKHPEYSGNSVLHDIAVVEIAPPLRKYTAVKLHSGAVPKPPAFGRVAGYGIVRPKSTTNKGMGVFRRVDLPIVDLPKCARGLANGNYRAPPQFVDNNYICAGYMGPNTCGGDACSGDSGGPICVRAVDGGDYVQIGVTSAGATCGEARVPGIYTNIAGHLAWIKSVARTGDKLQIVDAFKQPPPPPKKTPKPKASVAAQSEPNEPNEPNGDEKGLSRNVEEELEEMVTATPEPAPPGGGFRELENTGTPITNGRLVSIVSVSVVVGLLLLALIAFFAIRKIGTPATFASEDFEGPPPRDFMADSDGDGEAAHPSTASLTASQSSENGPHVGSAGSGGDENDESFSSGDEETIPSALSHDALPMSVPASTLSQVADTPSILGGQTVVPTTRGGSNAV